MAKHDKYKQQPLSPSPASTESPVPPAAPDSRDADLSRLKDELAKAQAEIGRLSFDKGVLEGAMAKSAENYEALLEQARSEHAALMKGLEDARDRAQAESKALRSDLVVLEQALAGHMPEVPLQTELGKSAAAGLVEVLHTLATLREQRREGPALPATGWASESARQLVEAVPAHERPLLLGDLLKQLMPHTGEQGQNETASDVLKRVLRENTEHALSAKEMDAAARDMKRVCQEQSEKMVKVQSAMVARRAPDAEAGGAMATISQLLSPYTSDGAAPGVKHLPGMLGVLLRQREDLLKFFSPCPLVAVAVRDDSAKVHERFSLLVLNWDGKAVSTRAVEELRPWGDISPYLDQTVRGALIPGAYR